MVYQYICGALWKLSALQFMNTVALVSLNERVTHWMLPVSRRWLVVVFCQMVSGEEDAEEIPLLGSFYNHRCGSMKVANIHFHKFT